MNSIPRAEWANQLQWGLTAPLLAAHLAGSPWALSIVLGTCLLSLVWYAVRLRSLRAYRVQVRAGFLLVVSLCLLPGLDWLAVIPLLGTTAQVAFGYCPMARALDLAPWNRSAPLSWRLIAETLTRRPGAEGLFSLPVRDRLAKAAPRPAAD